jgi:hypothetical protein
MLRHFLERAESGRLRGCGLFADDLDAGEQHCVAGTYSVHPALGSTAAMRMSIELAQVEDDEAAVSGWAPP